MYTIIPIPNSDTDLFGTIIIFLSLITSKFSDNSTAQTNNICFPPTSKPSSSPFLLWIHHRRLVASRHPPRGACHRTPAPPTPPSSARSRPRSRPSWLRPSANSFSPSATLEPAILVVLGVGDRTRHVTKGLPRTRKGSEVRGRDVQRWGRWTPRRRGFWAEIERSALKTWHMKGSVNLASGFWVCRIQLVSQSYMHGSPLDRRGNSSSDLIGLELASRDLFDHRFGAATSSVCVSYIYIYIGA